MSQPFSLEGARQLDGEDPLAGFRDEFHVPLDATGEEHIYFCGNSLGLQPKRAASIVEEELEDWARLGVKGHFEARRPWMPYHEMLAGHTAELVGALPAEVVTMNTLTVNLHLMMVSFFRPQGERRKLLIEESAFPSDRYAVESQLRFHGLDPRDALLEIGPRPGESLIRESDLVALIEAEGERIALILLPGVQYLTGQFFDLGRITTAGHAQGCVVGFDLAHAVGNLPLALHDWGVDFAVWCSYKYLNGGPGAVAGCFVHETHGENSRLPRFAGWWGHDKASRFEMGPDFLAIPGAEGWQLSNPPILATAPVLASLEIFHATGMQALREKSQQLTGFLEFGISSRLGEYIEILTPTDPARRGCQLSLKLRGAPSRGQELFHRLENSGVICDWREPDVIRVAPVPLYNRFDEVYRFVERLEQALTGLT